MSEIFSQAITVQCAEPAKLLALIAQWDRDQAATDIMGYMGTRVLADRERADCYILIADFGVVDPDVSAAEEAERNNERPATRAWAVAMRELVDGDPEYRHFDELYRTDR